MASKEVVKAAGRLTEHEKNRVHEPMLKFQYSPPTASVMVVLAPLSVAAKLVSQHTVLPALCRMNDFLVSSR